jgi:hypothetical protein
MTRDEWLALAARCEAATGADRGIDDTVWWAVCLTMPHRYRMNGETRETNVMSIAGGEDWRPVSSFEYAPSYTASLDAITALIQRELGEHACFSIDRQNKPDGRTWFGLACDGRWSPANRGLSTEEFSAAISTWAHTPALALCAALARAMAEKAST